ncbi:hypothetical protein K1719_032966 [Acacia pycnantha]|nr:hypothetical protein K1719_032966 [Acacia pycnantha]
MRKKKSFFRKPVIKNQKQQQQPSVDPITGKKIPKSFVFSRGKLPGPLRQLQMDLRKLMLPYTALNLKEKKRNNLKDFLNVAGPMVSVASSMPERSFQNSALIVLSGFVSGDLPLQLTTNMFQNIFPTIDVKTVNLSSCQRIVLLNYNKETKLIDFWHYSIRLQPVGVSRRIRKFVQNHQVPDLRNLHDVSDFITKAGYGSESEADDEAATVTLASDLGRVNRASTKSAVKLQEVGPRMTLKLIKIEKGLCSGEVLFSESGNDGGKGKNEDKTQENGDSEGEDEDEDEDGNGEDSEDSEDEDGNGEDSED